ncbi:Oidioi.mRNA.OKI2018_I69.chr2.g6906.t1.cds [Oikopleura dioica]|uniref:Oidioi.mRNA.OKI2018_I69.chr2.g6906.t1.cds n=1 Tax=Oikopleura dioica TaxID=34765 RepID=A0ABN7T6U6_OIKDI|nr:Oidioi.mRNA.OKI2018_I69.chr2.g6906.t1.cds [Oikopleura dioica]
METDEPIIPSASFGKRSMGYKRQAPRKHQVWLPEIPSMEGFTIDNKEMLMNLMDTVKLRMERREAFNDQLETPVSILRKKLNHMQRENTETLNKLRILEPQNEKLEGDNERLSKDNRRLEKKNRALMEAQRVYELDKKETEAEMQMMSSKLESENRTKKAIEMNAKRQIEDAKRKLELENSRKVRELEEKSKARKAAQEEKMKQLKSILFQNAPRTPAVSTRGDTNTMDYQQHLDAARLERKRTNSETKKQPAEPLEAPVKSPGGNSGFSLKGITNVRSPAGSETSVLKQLRGRKGNSRSSLNPRNETTQNIAVRRRSRSADKCRMLAHTPSETEVQGTIHQNPVTAKRTGSDSSVASKIMKALSAKFTKSKDANRKNVNVPQFEDLLKVENYLLTHQEANAKTKETTLLKGDVLGTRTGGTQVRFTGLEKLVSGLTPRAGVEDGGAISSETESESFSQTDLAVRCDRAVIHEGGAPTAQITGGANNRRFTQSQTSITMVDHTTEDFPRPEELPFATSINSRTSGQSRRRQNQSMEF